MAPKRHEWLNENLRSRLRLSPYTLFAEEAPEAIRSVWAVAFALGYPRQCAVWCQGMDKSVLNWPKTFSGECSLGDGWCYKDSWGRKDTNSLTAGSIVHSTNWSGKICSSGGVETRLFMRQPITFLVWSEACATEANLCLVLGAWPKPPLEVKVPKSRTYWC